MPCDMCGRNEKLVLTLVEGTEMNVCKNCSKYGKVLHKSKKKFFNNKRKFKPKFKEDKEKEVMLVIKPNYSDLIKQAREKKGVTQEEVANTINEKESIIHKIESNHFKPSIRLAKKLERFFRIKLVQEYEDKYESKKKEKKDGFTLGDFIKIKKK